MPRFGALQKFFGKTISDSASYAAGTATGNSLTPYLQEVINRAWVEHQSLPLDPDVAADAVAEDFWDDTVGVHEANQSGINGGKFEALTETKRTAPTFDQTMRMFRRGKITLETLHEAWRKYKFPYRWDAALEDLQHEKLDPSIVADAIVRGIIPAPFPVPFNPPGGGGKVPAYPTSPIDPVEEIKDSGYDLDQLALMTAIGGRPMSPVDAAQSVFRGIIDKVDYERAIAEGDIRPEYAEAQFEHTRTIPSVANYIEARVRNWISESEMIAGAAKHGMTEEDTKLLELTHGRPLSWHQTFIGLARGGVYDGPTTGIHPAFLKSLQESNIRPEWYHLAWAQRYNYPSAFVLRGMAQAGDLTQPELEQVLLYVGWEPKFAHTVSQRWTTEKTSATTSPTGKAQTQLWTATHRAYVNNDLNDAGAEAELAVMGLAPADVAAIMALWKRERDIRRLDLTPTQIKKAYGDNVLTRAEAVARLERQGMSAADAAILLDE